MFLILTCMFWIAYASQKTSTEVKNGKDLRVRANTHVISLVEDTLGECSAIVKAVGGFVHVYETENDIRRRSTRWVKSKLDTCASIADAVDTFREDYIPWTSGLVGLRLSEVRFLTKLLKEVSKAIGPVLYIASRDGDATAKFHSACDNQGPTVVIVETTTGAVFGGYTGLDWSSVGSYGSSGTSFLFRMRPAKAHYVIKKSKVGNAIYRHSSYGPTFGGGHDMYIASGALSNSKSYTNGGHGYKFPTHPNYQLADGSKHFQVKEYVVLKAVAL